jgi:predicted DNA-binding protein (MmcQ/YjbR family)
MDIEDLRKLCLSMPKTTEDIKWESNLVFSVATKMFCICSLDQSPVSASFKVKDEDFEEMCNRPGFKPAPYLARNKWVWVDDISRLNKADWLKNIKGSYELIKARFPLKTKKELGLL